MKIPMQIRPGRDGDDDFIISSFLKTAKMASIYRHVSADIFYPNMGEIFKRELLLSDKLVACNPENEDHILGVIVFAGDNLVWAYTKAIYRKLGVFTVLYDRTPGITTYKYKMYTSNWRAIEKKLDIKYNPFREVLF